ncbi:T9SS type A sorting domain-containing protein [Aureitalea sp. L0-47]|uniref:T9SS type A sorting domain-containing protein n=1 Tax=Aureitalea sp. L0-47 TaxID=2816962 RepID=UPI002237A665|nr:T9SS type A sorting domain-containing protein [Aureitalea sp. L0-47]MCW5520368.1 T9SS type A sorting domain-containing protein [Aureitalea sp. L0-47]
MKNLLLCTLLGALLLSCVVTAQSPVIDQDNQTRQVIIDDLEVVGSLGVGLDTPANQGYGFDTVILRENNLRMYFNDTSNSASFPSNDWRFTFNDSSNGGANYFSLDDVDANYQAFRVDAGAGSNAFRIESGGNVGIGISNPAVKLHVFNQDTPTMRLDQVGGFGTYRWDVAGNETNFFIRDVTTSGRLPFRIRPGALTSSIDIGSDGTVAINGTASNPNISIDLSASDRALLLNRMNNADRTSLGASLTVAEAGAIVYDTEDLLAYSWDGTQWVAIGVDTDDQTVDTFQLNGNDLELSLEDDGVPVNTVDLSGYLDNTDDQLVDTFQLNGNSLELSLESDGVGVNTVDLTGYLDNTDNQDLTLVGNTLSLTNDATTVDLSGYLDNTDNQDISGSNLAANILTIGITGGASEAVDLSSLDNSGTDDQQLSLAGNTLTLEDGGTVDLSGYLDNTDEQFLGFALNGNELTLLITNGNVVQIDLSPILQPLIDENAAQQAQIDDLIARLEVLEDCACMLRVPENIADPNRPMLFQNIPNPFDSTTTISYYVPINYSKANLVISNTRGQLLNNLPLEVKGEGSIDFGSGTLPSGVYFYSLFVDGKKIDTKRMIVE